MGEWGVNHSTKELAIGNPTHPTLPALHLTGSVQSACLRRHWRAGVRRGRGSGAAVRGRPNGLQCSRCGMPSCGFTWPVTGVQMCALHQRSHGCASVCVCVCPAPAQPQACKCVHVCPASAQALRQLGSIPLLRTPSPPGPRFSLTQVTFQPFPSPLFLPPSPKSANQMWVWVVREGGSVPPPSQGSP